MAMGAGVPVGDAEDAPLEQKADLPVYLLRLSGFVMTRLAKASRHSVEAFNFSAQPAFRDNYRRSGCLDNDSFDHTSSRRYFFSLGTGPLGT